ncbi:site-specific DNA-methyltransferase [Mycoplasma bradburyae]|uniref:Site-specific DNA-methyltransferase n=1 Tax=Mycoplasma bradburyae TaxID=2963128 RepID=A0ABT5GBQ5_9MOLU|nr:site-specific DNA-methyltransferase [Mycoplasma bradburyae]MDC4182234.1 site-specific DNA-methyltransferase [Mycoplasma bradburyae]UTS70058.1 site-specific DNA-methyltransferase [Mycoplasma bradburyae]
MMRWNLWFSSKIRERERESNNYLYDVIYIDPPYNTEHAAKEGNGVADDKENKQNKKFIYRDKFSRNGWLNMMQERLVLARKLLKEDGVIFVSIDDKEQAYLKVLMDEVFGEENFVVSMPFISNSKGRQANVDFAKTHEYILVYKMPFFTFNSLNSEYINSLMPNVYNKRKNNPKEDENGEYLLLNSLENSNWKFNNKTRPKLHYPIYINFDKKYYLTLVKTDKTIHTLWPKTNDDGLSKVWRWSKAKVEKDIDDLEVVVKNNEYYIFSKKRQLDFIARSLIMGPKLNNKSGNDLLGNIVKLPQNSEFTAKPLDLLIFLLKLHSNQNARILDFFSGSGTTAHAVMQLNCEDGGNRTFTLVTNNENNIGYGITYERLYRITQGKGTNSETFKWLDKNEPYNIGFNFYDVQQMNLSISSKNNIKEFESNIVKMLKDFGLEKPEEIELIKLRALKTIDKEQHE